MLGIQFGLLQYRSIFVSRVSDRDRNFLSPAGFVSHCCDSLHRQGNICPPQRSSAVVLLRLFVPRLIILVKNRNERLKSLNILACVQIGMWIKFQSELCIFFFVCEKISSFMVSINRKQEENIARNQGHFENTNNYQRYIVLHSGTIEYQENSVWRRSRLDLQRRVFRTMSYTIWAPQIFYLMKRKRKEDLQVNLWDFRGRAMTWCQNFDLL